jgi:acetoin utilization protein AcuB
MSTDLATTPVRDRMIPSPPTETPQTTVAAALRLLREHHLPALPVCEGGRVRGVVDEKALLRLTPSEATTLDVYELRAVLDRLTLALVTVTLVPTVTPDTPLIDAAALLLRTGRAVVLVVEGTRLAGLVTETTLLAAAIGHPTPTLAG